MSTFRRFSRTFALVLLPFVTLFSAVTPQIAHAAAVPVITLEAPQSVDGGFLMNFSITNNINQNFYLRVTVECLDATVIADCAPTFTNTNALGFSPIAFQNYQWARAMQYVGPNSWNYSAIPQATTAPFGISYALQLTNASATNTTYNNSFFITSLTNTKNYKITASLYTNGGTVASNPQIGTSSVQTAVAGSGGVTNVTLTQQAPATAPTTRSMCWYYCRGFYGNGSFGQGSGSTIKVNWTPGTANSVSYYQSDPAAPANPFVKKTYQATGYQVIVIPKTLAASTYASSGGNANLLLTSDLSIQEMAAFNSLGALQMEGDGCTASYYSWGGYYGGSSQSYASATYNSWYVDGLSTSSVTLNGCHFAKDESYVALVQPIYVPTSVVTEIQNLPNAPTDWNSNSQTLFPLTNMYQLGNGYNYGNGIFMVTGPILQSAMSAVMKADGSAGALAPELGAVTNVTAVPASTTDHALRGTLKVSWTAPTKDVYVSDFTMNLLNNAGTLITNNYNLEPSGSGRGGAWPGLTGLPPTKTATAPTSYVVTATRQDTSAWFGWLGWNNLANQISTVSCTATAPATTCTLSGLATWTKYFVQVAPVAAKAAGYTAFYGTEASLISGAPGSTIWPQAPSEPLNIMASSPNATSTTLSWDAPKSVGGPAGVVISKYTAAMVPQLTTVQQISSWKASNTYGSTTYTQSGPYGAPGLGNQYNAGSYYNSSTPLDALQGTNNLVAFTSSNCGASPNFTSINNAASGYSAYQGAWDLSRYISQEQCYNIFNAKGFVYAYQMLAGLNLSTLVDKTKYLIGNVNWVHNEKFGYIIQVQAYPITGTSPAIKTITAYVPMYPTSDTINTTTGDIPGGPNFAAAAVIQSQDTPNVTPFNYLTSNNEAALTGNYNTFTAVTPVTTDAHFLNATTVLLLTGTPNMTGTPVSYVYPATLSSGTWTVSSTSVLTIGCYSAPQALCTDFSTLKAQGGIPLPVANFQVNPVSGNLYFRSAQAGNNGCACCYYGGTASISSQATYRANFTGSAGTVSYGNPTKLPPSNLTQFYGCYYGGVAGGSILTTLSANYESLTFDANGAASSVGTSAGLYSEDATAGFKLIDGTSLPIQTYDWWPTPSWYGKYQGCGGLCYGNYGVVRTAGGQLFAYGYRWSGDPRNSQTWNNQAMTLNVMLDPQKHTCTTTGALTCTMTGTVKGAAYAITVYATNKESNGTTKDGPAGAFANVVSGLPNSPTYTKTDLTRISNTSNYSASVNFTASKKAGGVVDTSITKYSCSLLDMSGAKVLPVTGTIDVTPPAGLTATTVMKCEFPAVALGTLYLVSIVATSPEGDSYPASAQLLVAGATAPASVTYDVTQSPAALTYIPTSGGTTKVTLYSSAPSFTSSGTSATPISGATCTDANGQCVPSGLAGGSTYYALVCTTNALNTSVDATTGGDLSTVNAGANPPVTIPTNCTLQSFATPADPTPDVPTLTVTPGDGTLTIKWTLGALNGTVVKGLKTGIAIGQTTVTTATGCTSLTATSTTCTYSGLTNGTIYSIYLGVSYSYGAVTYGFGPAAPYTSVYGQAQMAPFVPLAAPTGVSATAGVSKSTVSWTAPTAPTNYTINSYTVTAAPGGLTCTVTAPATTCDVTGLTNGTAYTFTVTANYTFAGTSPATTTDTVPSSASTAVTPQAVAPTGKPGSVTGVAGNGSADVSFTAVTDDGGSPITQYVVTSSPGGKTCTATAPATTCTVTGLTNGTDYTFTVVAKNAKGNGPASDPSGIVTPQAQVPQPPTNVTVTAKSATVLTVAWTAPTDNGGSAITQYTVTATDGTNTFNCTATAPAVTCDVTGLTTGTAYTVSVVATNYKGNSTAATASGTYQPAVAPDAPSAPTATVGSTSALVTWTAPANNGSEITLYTVTSSPGGKTCTAVPPATSCTVTGLTIGTNYTFTVKATNGKGQSGASGASNSITGASAPSTLAAPTVTPVSNNNSNGQLTVNWKAPTNANGTISGYTVTASPGGATCTTTGALTCTVTGLTNGTAYTFTVTATNQIGNSLPSGPSLPATPSTLSQAPTAVTATATPAGATVSWTAPTDNGGNAPKTYLVTSSPGGKTCTATAPATTCNVAGLTNGTDYTFTVTATNVNGASTPSDPSATVTPAAAPTAPTISSVTKSAAGQATITFTTVSDPAGAPVTGYTVTAMPGNITCQVTDPTATTCDMPGLTGGVSYTFTVKANNRVGSSPASRPSAALVAVTNPSVPTNVVASLDPLRKTVDQQAYVSWTAPTSTGGAAIKGYVVTAAPGGATCVAVGKTNCVVTGLTNGTAYTFTVVAVNDPTFSATASTNQNYASASSDPSAPFTPYWQNQNTSALVLTPPTGPTGGSTVSTTYSMPVTVNFSPTPPATTYTIKLNGKVVGTLPASSCVGTVCSFTWTPANKYVLRLSDDVTIAADNGQVLNITPKAPSLLPVAELHYGSGLSTVTAGSAEATFLAQVAQLVKDNGYLTVTLTGYTDDDGAAAANLTLSKSRATNAGTYLKSQLALLGITKVTIVAIGKGISTTYGSGCAGSTSDGCAKNRRVMIAVSGQLAAPTAPQSASATARNLNVAVSWKAPVATNGSPITGYTVYYDLNSDYLVNGAPLTPSATDDATDMGNWLVYCTTTTALTCTKGSAVTLVNDTAYNFLVVATNAIGTSLPSAVVDGTPTLVAPDAPTVAVSGVTKAAMSITVTAPADNGGSDITGYTYTIKKGTTTVASGALTAGTAQAVSGLTAATAYTVTVTATNTIGTSLAATKTVTTLAR